MSNKIDKIFKDKLSGARVEPPANGWANISQATPKVNPTVLSLKTIGATITTASVVGVTVWQLSKEPATKDVMQELPPTALQTSSDTPQTITETQVTIANPDAAVPEVQTNDAAIYEYNPQSSQVDEPLLARVDNASQPQTAPTKTVVENDILPESELSQEGETYTPVNEPTLPIVNQSQEGTLQETQLAQNSTPTTDNLTSYNNETNEPLTQNDNETEQSTNNLKEENMTSNEDITPSEAEEVEEEDTVVEFNRWSVAMKLQVTDISGGLFVGYNFSPKWSLETGLFYRSLPYSLSLYSTDNSDEDSNEQDDLNIVQYPDATAHYIHIPLILRYNFIRKKLHVGALVGGGLGVLIDNGYDEQNDFEANDVVGNDAQKITSFGTVGIEINYPISKNFRILFSPQLDFYPQLYQQTNSLFKESIYLGVGYSF